MRAIFAAILVAVIFPCLPLACAQEDDPAGRKAARGGERPAAADVLPGYKRFRHPLGLKFQVPRSWTVQETNAGLQIVPPDAGRSAMGPTEYYAFVAQPAAKGVKRPDDPRVLRYLDTAVRRMLPFLRPSGGATDIRVGARRGAAFTWKGQNPSGQAVTGKVFAVLIDNCFFGLTAIALDERLERREATLSKILTTVDVAPPVIDRRLVGVWYHKSYRSAGIGVRDRLNFASTTRIILLADGTCHAGGNTAISGTLRNPGGTVASSLTALARSCPEHGRWAAANGRVYLMWDDGAVGGYGVHVQGPAGRREALLTSASGEKLLWTEYDE